jgi:hypothetical protein
VDVVEVDTPLVDSIIGSLRTKSIPMRNGVNYPMDRDRLLFTLDEVLGCSGKMMEDQVYSQTTVKSMQ